MQTNVEKLINNSIGTRKSRLGRYYNIVIIKLLKRILYVERINKFTDEHSHLDEKHFISELFEYLNFSYLISNRDLQKIPSEGKLICVANHPIGSLDSLCLLKAVLEIRSDVRIVANEILTNIGHFNRLILPVKLDSKGPQKTNILAIHKALEEEKAVIIFPAATVSRLKGIQIEDSKWNKGAVHFAKIFNAPVLPIFINAKNSFLFYLVSVINKRLSSLLLAHELFNKKNRTIQIKIGDLIPAKAFHSSCINDTVQAKLLKKHVYLIGKNKKGIYTTEKNVIHPVDRKAIKSELNKVNLLGITNDNLKIYLTNRTDSPHSLNEIARLREITFRKVGEGTGKNLDLDKYDSYYKHLIIWDDKDLEIIGSYRIGSGKEISNQFGKNGFYTSSLFNYSDEFKNEIASHSIELGRSFVQKKYWNSNALNYLWQGIGAYLASDSSIKYMFGGVSISNSYPENIREAIVYYFNKWYGNKYKLAQSRRQYFLDEKKNDHFNQIFTGITPKEDYKTLKQLLKPFGLTIPILYKHYSDLCEEGGVKFLDFGVDPDFENCVDGLILVDVDMIKEEKRQKYINKFQKTAILN